MVIPALTTLCVLFFGLMLIFAWEARQYRKLCDDYGETLGMANKHCSKLIKRYADAVSKLNQINEITNSASDDDDATDEN